jgi:hypothetical protein
MDSLLSDLVETWNAATLHFMGVEGKGTDSIVDIGLHQSPSPIIFNRNIYPPTKKGVKMLKLELVTQALSLRAQANLTCNNQKHQLDCLFSLQVLPSGKKATTNKPASPSYYFRLSI